MVYARYVIGFGEILAEFYARLIDHIHEERTNYIYEENISVTVKYMRSSSNSEVMLSCEYFERGKRVGVYFG